MTADIRRRKSVGKAPLHLQHVYGTSAVVSVLLFPTMHPRELGLLPIFPLPHFQRPHNGQSHCVQLRQIREADTARACPVRSSAPMLICA